MDVLSNDKRWLVILVTLNKVLAPVLTDIAKQGMENLYNYLDNLLNGLSTPCSLKTLTYADFYRLTATPSPASFLESLNFGNINNNSDVHGKKKKAYNYNVSSPVDLARLYLPNYLAVFSAFDKSMDMSATLRLLGRKNYPIQIFFSSDPSYNIQSLADDVRENVRNRASHFDESHWTQIFFGQCFDKLKKLVQGLPLNAAKTKELLDQLSKWKTKGFQLIVKEDVKDLMAQFQNDKLKAIEEKLEDKPTKEEIEKMIQKLSEFGFAVLSAKLDEMKNEVLSELKDIKAITLKQESSKSAHPSRSSVSSADATSKFEKTLEAKAKYPDSNCKLRAENAKLSRRALHKAAINGQCKVIKALLESGEDVDQTDKFGSTPLHLAALYGQGAVVKLLLQHGANVNAVDSFQKTALQKADRNNHRYVAGLLMRNDATSNYNQPPSLKSLSRKALFRVDARSGFNQLQAAVFHGDYNTVWNTRWFLDDHVSDMYCKKTGSQAKVFPGKTASEILSALQDKGEGYVKIDKLYKEHCEKVDTLTELHLCQADNDVEKAVELVLNEGVDINTPGKSNRTPLFWASPSASGEFIKTLIDLGADLNAQRTDDKAAPLCLAVYGNNYMAVDILLKHGADVGLLNVSENLQLHECVVNGQFGVLRLLIDSGCDINVRNNKGQSPLYLAVKNKHKYIVKYLLENKADVHMKYKENASERIYIVRGKDRGKPAWHYVLVAKGLEPLFLRRTKGGSLDVADFGLVLTSGWGKDPPEAVRKNVNEMGDTFPETQSSTVLHVASKSASLEIVDLLVKHKADINAPDADGFTPLHLAAMYGNIQVVKKLVETNADVNLKVDGKDAADLARMNEETEIEEYLKPKRSLPERDSESQSAQCQLVESQSAESKSAEIQPAESQSVLEVAIKGAGQGLRYLEHGLKFLEEKFN